MEMIIIELYVTGKALCAMMYQESTHSFSMANHYNVSLHINYTLQQSAPKTIHLTSP